jgi:DNA-binding Xre family transcriptional regulator
MGQLKNNFRKLLMEKYGASGDARLPTQRKIADDIGLKQGTISLWLGDKVTRYDKASIERICKFLDCDVGTLLVYVPDPGERKPPETLR